MGDRLTSGTLRRRGTSPDGAQSACRASAYAVLARRVVPCVAAVEHTIVHLGRVVAGRGGTAEVWRGEDKGGQVRLGHGLRRRGRRRVD